MQKWHVEISKKDSKKLRMVLRSKKVTMETKKRAQVLLDLDESVGKVVESLNKIAARREVCQNTIISVRKNYVEAGLDKAIFRKKRETSPVPAKVTGEVEAHIIAVCCSSVPEGKSRWSM